MKKLVHALVLTGLVGVPAAAMAAEESPHKLSANVTLTSDYVFRGISQTGGDPAIQGGFDYTHSSGFYLGTWASNVGWIEDFQGYDKGNVEIGDLKAKAAEHAKSLACLMITYPSTHGVTYRNRASALDYHRFLQALWYDQLPYSAELRRLMYLPNRDRVYTGAAGVARQTWVFDKTGTTARLCGDMGILVAQGREGRRYPYTFIGIIEKARRARNYVAWKNTRGNVIREVSSITYGHLRQMYNLA